MKILWAVIVAAFVLVPTAAFGCEEAPAALGSCEPAPSPSPDEILLDFEEESSCSGGGVCSQGYFDCMSACGDHFGYLTYHNGSWWGLSSCTVQSGVFRRRVNCYYSR
jgi:hypothetical protein